jgi:hypothetical protein
LNTNQNVKSNSGKACTCVVTEYHYHASDDFVIDIEYFTIQELRAQYEQLLRDYREFQSSVHAENVDEDERAHLKRRADLATNTFMASFGDRVKHTPGVLDALPVADSTNIMVEWLNQILPFQVVQEQSRFTQETFPDKAECASRLQILTSEIAEPGYSCLWPFIKKLRYAVLINFEMFRDIYTLDYISSPIF